MKSNYMKVIEQSDEEKMAMYMKCSKKELASMLIQCNKILDSPPTLCRADIDPFKL